MKFRTATSWSSTLVFILLLVHANAQGVQKTDGSCLNYELGIVTLRGKLERRTFTNVSGVRETHYILKLDKPICVNADPNNEYNQQQKNISELQLVPFEGVTLRVSGARALLNRRVVASGVLFGAHTQHHFTKVLLSVKEIKAAGKPSANEGVLLRPGAREGQRAPCSSYSAATSEDLFSEISMRSNAHHSRASLPQPTL